MLLARKGYTLDPVRNMLVPLAAEGAVDSAGYETHPQEIPEADEYGRDVVTPSVAYDAETGKVWVTTTTRVEGAKRLDEDNYSSVIDSMTAETNRQFFDTVTADRDDEDVRLDQSMWVEGELFGIAKLIDADITSRYHAKLLNVYYDKTREKMATGSVRFTVSPAGLPAFYCVRPDCACAVTWEGFAGNGLDFIWLAYVHGLNHGAKFARPYGERVLNDPYLTDDVTGETVTIYDFEDRDGTLIEEVTRAK